MRTTTRTKNVELKMLLVLVLEKRQDLQMKLFYDVFAYATNPVFLQMRPFRFQNYILAGS
jgi:hypothetical protein